MLPLRLVHNFQNEDLLNGSAKLVQSRIFIIVSFWNYTTYSDWPTSWLLLQLFLWLRRIEPLFYLIKYLYLVLRLTLVRVSVRSTPEFLDPLRLSTKIRKIFLVGVCKVSFNLKWWKKKTFHNFPLHLSVEHAYLTRIVQVLVLLFARKYSFNNLKDKL